VQAKAQASAAYPLDRAASVMNLLTQSAARLVSAALTLRTGPQLSILIFHRVLPERDPLFPREMFAARFDRTMAAVAGAFDVKPLTEAVALLKSGQARRRMLAITFDDGYADNATIALPILQRHRLPATFYVSTGFLNGGRMWNDTVIECMRHTRQPVLDLQALGLGQVPAHTVAERRAAISRVIPVIKYMGLQDRQAALAALLQAAGQPQLPDDLMMRSEQVLELHRAGMEIGAHTVNHPILTALPDAHARHEIATGRDELETLIGAPVRTLAYPNGGPDRDYAKRHAAMAQELGFDAAVTTAVGVSRSRDDMFQLPRFTPWDEQVSRWLMRLVVNQRNTGFRVATN
jgi:peptidoglycan/xylan/chitin deacetylase (PgdA/CDA1 family)